MSDGKWSGGAANRSWNRPGSRLRAGPETAQRDHRLYEQMKDLPFYCETCGQMHPMVEHQRCRDAESARPNIIAAARQSLSPR